MFEHIKIKMMKGYLFLEYPACSTCRKAKKSGWMNKSELHGSAYRGRTPDM